MELRDFLALMLGAAVLAACSANIEPDVSGLQQSIVNGKPTQGDHAVVQLQLNIEGGVRYNCTGSLIASDRVLTAAHCLPEYFFIQDEPRKLETVDVYFGYDDRQQPSTAGLPARIAAKSWCRNPKAPLRDVLPGQSGARLAECSGPFAPDTTPVRPLPGLESYAGRFDTAIVYLEEPAPAAIAPLPLSFELPPTSQLTRLRARIVGFGATEVVGENQLIGNGIKREGEPRVLGLFDGEDDDFERYLGTLQIERADDGAAAGCKEDSGGPLFMELSPNDWKIIATTSHGDPNCTLQVQYAPLQDSAVFLEQHL